MLLVPSILLIFFAVAMGSFRLKSFYLDPRIEAEVVRFVRVEVDRGTWYSAPLFQSKGSGSSDVYISSVSYLNPPVKINETVTIIPSRVEPGKARILSFLGFLMPSLVFGITGVFGLLLSYVMNIYLRKIRQKVDSHPAGTA